MAHEVFVSVVKKDDSMGSRTRWNFPVEELLFGRGANRAIGPILDSLSLITVKRSSSDGKTSILSVAET